jgi:signal transduction histidine kinase
VLLIFLVRFLAPVVMATVAMPTPTAATIQAMPNGGKLTVRGFKKENKAYISVEDNGVGIPEEVKPKLFTPMVTTKAKGQGLGLAVVKRLVEPQGGTINFESEIGSGTKFILEFPLEEPKK